MKKILFLALLVFSCTSVASDWLSVGTSNDSEVYFIDASSIKPINGGVTSAWIRVDLLKTKWQGLFKESAKRYMDNMYVDCTNEKFTTTDRVIYGPSGNSISSQHWQANFISAAPGSMAKKITASICEKSIALSKGESISGLPENTLNQTSWKFVTQDNSTTTYIGTNNYSWGEDVLDGVIFFVVRHEYKQPKAIGNDLFNNYIVQWAARCDNQNMFVAQDSYYGMTSQLLARTEFEVSEKSLMKAAPDSIGMEFLKTACNDFTKPIKQSNKPNSKQPSPGLPGQSIGSGTAWQVSSNQLVTAYHVVDGAKSMVIAMPDNSYKQARVVASDPSNDLALIQIIEGTLSTKPLSLATKQPKLGSKVAVLGFPLSDVLGTKVQATSGEISKLGGIRDDLRFFQISAAVQSGNSGGPLLNQQGEVVGVVSSKLNTMYIMKEHNEVPQNVNFAVKYPYVAALLESANVASSKSQKKTNKIEDAITQSKESVYLLFVASETK